MEMVVELETLRLYFFPWKRLVRGGMTLAMIGMLFVGSHSYAKDCTAECKEGISGPKMGTIDFSQSTKDCRWIVKDVTNLPVFAKEEMITELLSAVEAGRETTAAEFKNEKKTDIPIISIEEEPVGDSREEVPADGSGKEAGGEKPAEAGREEASADGSGKDAGGEETVEGGREEEGEGENVESDVEEEPADDSEGESGIREVSGFQVDEDGYITGITERLNLTDGILIFTWDEGCVGIRAGALSGLAGCVEEIYIPPNIREIEPGALDEFIPGVYIEVAADHPCYYSKDGILYLR